MKNHGLSHLPPHSLIELLHSNIRWYEGIELINNGFSNARARKLYRKGIKCVDDIWENDDWISLTSKIINKWTHLLEKDPKTTCIGQWIGFFCNGAKGLAFVLQCSNDFIP